MNYAEASSSNRFRVRDPHAFRDLIDSIPDISISALSEKGYVALTTAYGGWLPIDPESQQEIDFPNLLQEHLPDDEVAVLLHVGHEGRTQHLHAAAFAICGGENGGVNTLSLNDIYEQAARRFSVPTDHIDRAY